MATPDTQVFGNMAVDHIRFYVTDIGTKTDWLVDGYGFAVHAQTDAADRAAEVRSVGLDKNKIRLVLTEPLVGDHPGAAYVEKHGDGVADIGLGVTDAAAAFHEAVLRGARPVSAPVEHGGVVTATIMGFGDVAHTFVQRVSGSDDRALPGLRPVAATPAGADTGLVAVDHLAVCMEPGQLEETVRFYQQVLDFELIFTESLAIGSQAMTTKVVQSSSGAVTLTLIEPDVSRDAGHLDDFLKSHGGTGVQHIALTATDIVTAVDSIRSRGVEFLSAPAAYYGLLGTRMDVDRYPVDELQRLNILVDEDHDGQLYQIFTRSLHPRNTLFLELIERVGARSFGSGNIRALYEAVELQRNKGEAIC